MLRGQEKQRRRLQGLKSSREQIKETELSVRWDSLLIYLLPFSKSWWVDVVCEIFYSFPNFKQMADGKQKTMRDLKLCSIHELKTTKKDAAFLCSKKTFLLCFLWIVNFDIFFVPRDTEKRFNFHWRCRLTNLNCVQYIHYYHNYISYQFRSTFDWFVQSKDLNALLWRNFLFDIKDELRNVIGRN